MLSVSVKTLEGNNRSFELSDDTTVRQFKESINREMEIPVDQIRLIFQGKVLVENQLLKDVGVDGKVVHLVRREPPMSGRSQSSNRGNTSTSSASAGSTSAGNDSGQMSLEEQLSAESLRAMIQEILSGMGDAARMATVVTEQSEEGGFDIQVNIPPAVPRRSLARMRQRYVGAIDSQARAVARWLEEPERYTRPQPDYVVLRRSERSVDPTVDENEAADNSADSPFSRPAASTTGNSEEDGSATVVDPVSASELAEMVEDVDNLWAHIRPLIGRWQNLLREDPALSPSSDTNTERQRLYDGVSRLLHLHSHMLHHVSDFIVEMTNPPPRRLLVMAETPMQSFSVRINVDMEQFASADLRSGLRTQRRAPNPATAQAALPLFRFIVPAAMGAVNNARGQGGQAAPPDNAGVRAQRGQTADGTGYVWASAGPHVDYELRPDIFAVNSSWTHIFSDVGNTETPPPPSSQPPTSRASAAQPRTTRGLDVQSQPTTRRANTFQHDMYSRVLEQALRQSIPQAAMEPEQNRFGAPGEQVLGAAVVGPGGNTWTSVDPYLSCNSRHFVEYDVSSRGMEVGGRRVFLGTHVQPLVMDGRGRPHHARASRQRGAGVNPAPPRPSVSPELQRVLAAALRALMPQGVENVVSEALRVLTETLSVGEVLESALRSDFTALDRLRTPLRHLFRRRVSGRGGSVEENVRRIVEEGMRDDATMNGVRNAQVGTVIAQWMEERRTGRDIDWHATIESMSIAYVSQLVLLTLDSPTDVGYGQLLFNELTGFVQQLYALLRHVASPADLAQLLERLANSLTQGHDAATLELTMFDLTGSFHRAMETSYQNLTQAAFQILLDRWIVRRTSDKTVAMEVEEEEEDGYRTPPESSTPPLSARPLHCPTSRSANLPDNPLEVNPQAHPVFSDTSALPANWRDVLPSDWINVIAHDAPSGSESPASEDVVEPLSDAYVSGMPAKRRRLMLAARTVRQPGPPSTMLQDVLREALEERRVDSTSMPIATGNGLEQAFRDYTSERIGERLAGSNDFDATRFPEMEKMFGGEMRRIKKKKKQ